MIWTTKTEGIIESGWFRLNRVTQGWEAWWTHPKSFRLVGKASVLEEAKALVENYVKERLP